MTHINKDFRTSVNPHMGYHIAPKKGLLNDPQGLVQKDGIYHLFHQWNPKGLKQENKAWAHMISKDLVTWKELPVAIYPDQYYDKDGCYTGSAIVHDDKIYIFYTGNVRGENQERFTYQCVAVSTDGINFKKLGPIIDVPKGYTAHIRDPKVWRSSNATFYMLLGAQTEDLTGTALLYKSEDLMNWELLGPFTSGLSKLGYMWECPNYIKFPELDVFQFSPQGLNKQGLEYHNIHQSGYVTGWFQQETFLVDNPKFEEIDRGFEFYAPQFFVDESGRIIMFAWMGYMSIEKEEQLPTLKDDWAHTLTIPREVVLKNGRIVQKPIPEITKLRANCQTYYGNTNIALSSNELEIIVTHITTSIKLNYRNEVLIEYEDEDQTMFVSRTDWVTKEREVRGCKLKKKCTDMRIYIEKTSFELFVNNGEETFSLRYFTNHPNTLDIDMAHDNVELHIYTLDVTNIEHTVR